MKSADEEILQFVGFATTMDTGPFVARWKPVALQFKNAGVRSIHLYEVLNQAPINLISCNRWPAERYHQMFPSGMASEASAGGISVVQFGGFRSMGGEETDLPWRHLAFLRAGETAHLPGVNEYQSIAKGAPYDRFLSFHGTHAGTSIAAAQILELALVTRV